MVREVLFHYRQLLGVLIKDWGRYRRALAEPGTAYLRLRNRNEVLEAAPDGNGYRCAWRWTSDLHAPKLMPSLGRRLMERSLVDHPICRVSVPADVSQPSNVSFVIGHRGIDRLPHLLATLESVAGQRNASFDCVVVEQDVQPRIATQLPAWVRHVHSPPPAPEMPYCRSWAFNVGVKQCRGNVLILHDNDMLVPADYAASVLEHVRQGYEVVNLKRYIFYLTEQHSRSVSSRRANVTDEAPLSIVQNLEAGGSIAITREGYARIGGMDESFIGWGGEDNEFWERAQTLQVWPYAYLPIVHLWHAAQPGKLQAGSNTAARYRDLSAIPAATRISRLSMLRSGEMSGPVG